MAANVRIVPKKHWNILQEYLCNDADGIVLIPMELVNTLNIKEDITDGTTVSYDFGGEADVWLDIVTDKSHLFLNEILEKKEKKDV